jgi:predicted xylose isomerase-like sugar epimerase
MFRSLSPAAIGVKVGSLGALAEIGYDGPVMVEPFSEEVRLLSDKEACAVVAAALEKVWEKGGL